MGRAAPRDDAAHRDEGASGCNPGQVVHRGVVEPEGLPTGEALVPLQVAEAADDPDIRRGADVVEHLDGGDLRTVADDCDVIGDGHRQERPYGGQGLGRGRLSRVGHDARSEHDRQAECDDRCDEPSPTCRGAGLHGVSS